MFHFSKNSMMKLIYNPAIYKITNIKNNRFYIGSSLYPEYRRIKHFEALKYNRHENIFLQRSFNKHGIHNFKFEIIQFFTKEILRIEEQKIINTFINDKNICYNIAKNTEAPMQGRKHTKEALEKMRIASIGNKNCLGKHLTKEHKKKISLFHKGKILSEETKMKISLSSKENKSYLFGKFRKEHHSSKKIYKYTKDNIFIKEYNCLLDAAEELGDLLKSKNISCCARGNIKSAYGFIWKYNKE